MKIWITNETEKTKNYLIATENSIWITEETKDVNINDLIENNELSNMSIYKTNDIKEVLFNESDSQITIEFKDSKIKDIEINTNSEVFTDVNNFFVSNLKGVEIKNYSLLKQIKPSLFGTALFGGITWVLYTTALSIQNGQHLDTSGRRSLIRKIIVGIADFLGPTGSLIVGGLLTLLFVYTFINTIRKPKEGKVLKTLKKQEIKFSF
ncbi:hypothetical protein C8N26_0531 [Tenacibaculum lutimaris]|uniref:Uncharacterized protein n=1 Tax=Tenacibaculum lutimaris TaxID=285258 RepID=A0A420E508_9FLAO|nr:hypothetical protein [Tenacibaculum lutimaris]RKF05130.1 hypothetical protein C8N26_0531 [Tenacibaculum lutimaris]